MKRILLLTPLLALCGCVQVSGTYRTPEGGLLTVNTHRCFWQSEGIAFTASTGTNGLAASLSVQKSSTDATSIANVFSGLQGLGVSLAPK